MLWAMLNRRRVLLVSLPATFMVAAACVGLWWLLASPVGVNFEGYHRIDIGLIEIGMTLEDVEIILGEKANGRMQPGLPHEADWGCREGWWYWQLGSESFVLIVDFDPDGKVRDKGLYGRTQSLSLLDRIKQRLGW